MITLEALKACGADVDTGLARCMGMKDFYLRLVGQELNDPHFDALEAALAAGRVKEAFEAAHALKGATGNLALTSIYEPVSVLTEKLRNADTPVDTGDLLPRILKARAELKTLAE